KHDLPGVGRNLQDHPCVDLWFDLQEDATPSGTSQFEVTLRFTSETSPWRNDLQINCCLGRMVPDSKTSRLRLDPLRAGLGVHLYRPVGSGLLSLNSNNATHPPRLDYGYLESEGDRSRMRFGVRHAFRIAQQAFAAAAQSVHQLDTSC